MGTAITAVNREEITPAQIMERVIATGDLSKLTPEERVAYYRHTCESLGLNPLTRPFDYLTLNNKIVLYARKDCADQLRNIHRVSIIKLERANVNDLYVVTATAQLPDGRMDSEIGAVNIKGIAGEALANAMMKASTKAKRRVTLSICGLGILDESELDTIPTARAVNVDTTTGVIQQQDPQPTANGNGAKKAETPEQKAAAGQKYLRKAMTEANFNAWDIDQACEAIDAISDLLARFQVYKSTHTAVKEKRATDTTALMAFISDAIAEINAPTPEESAE